jgi:hypothetical protein
MFLLIISSIDDTTKILFKKLKIFLTLLIIIIIQYPGIYWYLKNYIFLKCLPLYRMFVFTFAPPGIYSLPYHSLQMNSTVHPRPEDFGEFTTYTQLKPVYG